MLFGRNTKSSRSETRRMSTSSRARMRSRNAHSSAAKPPPGPGSAAWRAREPPACRCARPCAPAHPRTSATDRMPPRVSARALESGSAGEHALEQLDVLSQVARPEEVVADPRLRRLAEALGVVRIGEQLGHARAERRKVVRRDQAARAAVLDLVL